MEEGRLEETKTVSPVPKWLQVRFGQLWDKFGHKAFSLCEATDTVHESKEVVAVILSRLRKSGWLIVAFDKEDFRKRKYQLISPSDLFRKIDSRGGVNNAQNHKD